MRGVALDEPLPRETNCDMTQAFDHPALRICLQPLTPDHARNFALLLGGDAKSVSMMSRMPQPCTRKAAKDWIVEQLEPLSCAFGIVRKSDRDFLGAIALNTDEIVPELGYWVGRPYWSRGYATEAVQLMESVAQNRGIRRLAAETFPHNQASQRVLVKAGFQQGGVFLREWPADRPQNTVFRYEKELRC